MKMSRLYELRIQRKLTLDDIERKTGIKRGTYSNYENNKTEPKLVTWQKLAEFYKVPISYLRGEIDTELIAKIAKMVFLIETTPFYTDYGFTNNLIENSRMVCSLMLLLIKQINLNCNDEFKTVILKSQKILNDKKFECIFSSVKSKKPVSYVKAKHSIEDISGISDKNNLKSSIETAKALIDFFDKI